MYSGSVFNNDNCSNNYSNNNAHIIYIITNACTCLSHLKSAQSDNNNQKCTHLSLSFNIHSECCRVKPEAVKPGASGCSIPTAYTYSTEACLFFSNLISSMV